MTKTQTQTFQDILAHSQKSLPQEAQKEEAFAYICQFFLSHNSIWKMFFKEVMPYKKWSEQASHTEKDGNKGINKKSGIDLIGLTQEGKIYAIACRNDTEGKENKKIEKADLHSFITASAAPHYAGRLLITNLPISDAVKELINHHNITFISGDNLAYPGFDWGMCDIEAYCQQQQEKSNQAGATLEQAIKEIGGFSHWRDLREDMPKKVKKYRDQITPIITQNKEIAQAMVGLTKMLNPLDHKNFTQENALECLVQYAVITPIYEAILEDYKALIQGDPLIEALKSVTIVLEKKGCHPTYPKALIKDLQEVSSSIKHHQQGFDKKAFIRVIYERVILPAFPEEIKRNGAIYTPIEVVDFILHSINDILVENFDRGMGDNAVHLLDPFSKIGDFVTRLLSSGILSKEEIKQKYQTPMIWANEKSFHSYYTAQILIALDYYKKMGDYTSFKGGIFADSLTLPQSPNSSTIAGSSSLKQEIEDEMIHVIASHFPASSAITALLGNGDSIYEVIDDRIKQTYGATQTSINMRALYSDNVRALRWASDRIGDKGVLSFITTDSFLENEGTTGLRKCLSDEFNDLYILHLRGSIYARGEEARKDGENIFGMGIRAGTALYILVKNPSSQHKGKIHFYDIGDYLSREEKLTIIKEFGSIKSLSDRHLWQRIIPDQHHDWLNQRDENFEHFPSLINKAGQEDHAIFNCHSLGIATNRDGVFWNFSQKILAQSCQENLDNDGEIRLGSYRPFCKEWVIYSRSKKVNMRLYKQAEIFPKATSQNKVIVISGPYSSFSCLMTNHTPDHSFMDHSSVTIPLYHYKEGHRKNALNDAALAHFQAAYKEGDKMNQEDLFYYIYGLFHSPDYRKIYGNNLKKELPRIPRVKSQEDFWAFVKVGRALGELHLNYDTIEPYYSLSDPHHVTQRDAATAQELYHLQKMRFARKDGREDKSCILYNDYITIDNIPGHLYDYSLNGRSAIEWVMDRYQIRTDKRSGITNDPNQAAKNPQDILLLLLRVMRVADESLKLIKSLPQLTHDTLLKD